MRNVLVTGGCGFIGSNFVKYLLREKGEIRVVNLDLLTYAGNPENVAECEGDARYRFVRGDVCDRALVEEVFARYGIDTVVHFAAESHVDRSIEDPEVFLRTNILGTQVLLEAARRSWSLGGGEKHSRAYRAGVRYLQVSTDEVYGALGPEEAAFTEERPLAPNSPYSASKAGADLLVRAYHETYGLPVQITRCSNNYGPYQFPEKLIPLMIHNALEGKALPVYGDGLQVRDWLYVEDHCRAIAAVLDGGQDGAVYNIGGGNERTNLEIVRLILGKLGKPETQIEHVEDRPGHDRRYAIDSGKIERELGWRPRWSFADGIARTIEWYLEHADWVERIVHGEYAAYYAKMYG